MTLDRPPFLNPLKSIIWEYQQQVQELYKAIGLPASKNAAILSYMLSDLQQFTELKLGIKITQAVAVLPYLPMLLDQDLQNAFENAGIKQLSGRKDLFEKTKKYPYGGVSMGHGICRNWEDKNKCNAEEKAMPREQILSLTYTNESLQIDNLLVHTADNVVRGYSKSFRSLGSQSLDLEKKKSDLNIQEIEGHQERLKQGIISQIKSAGRNTGKNKYQRLVIMGESGEDNDFLQAVWIALDALESLGFLEGRFGGMYSVIQTPGFSALYTGARGAADLAIRWQDKRNATRIAATKIQESIPASLLKCHHVKVAYGTKDSKRVIMDDTIASLNLDVNYVVNALWRMTLTETNEPWSIEVLDCVGYPRILHGIMHGSSYWSQVVQNSEFESKVNWKDGTTSEEVAYDRVQDNMPRSRVQTIDYLIRTLNLNPIWVQFCVQKFRRDPQNKVWSIHAVKVPSRDKELWLVMGGVAKRIIEPAGSFLEVEKVAWGEIKSESEQVLVLIDARSQDFGDALTTQILQSKFRSHDTRDESWEIWARKADHGTLAPLWVFFDGKFAYERTRP